MPDELRNEARHGFSIIYHEVLDVFGDVIGPNGLLTYYALARFASNDTHRCFPSIAKIMAKAQLSRSSVKRSLQAIEQAGLLRIEHRKEEDISQSNVYVLTDVRDALATLAANGQGQGPVLPEPGRFTQNLPRSTQNLPPVHTEPTPRFTQNLPPVLCEPLTILSELDSREEDSRELDPTTKSACANEAPIVPEIVDMFDTFWATYPKRKAKVDAVKAWAKLTVTPSLLDRMLAAIAQQKLSAQWRRDAGEAIPYPATWLNGHRWEDEPDRPQGATAHMERLDAVMDSMEAAGFVFDE